MLASPQVDARLLAQIPGDWELPPAPVVDEVWAWAWTEWHRLHLDRPYNGGGLGPPVPGRIPWRDVALWADRNCVDIAELDVVIFEMDTAYLEYLDAKRRSVPP